MTEGYVRTGVLHARGRNTTVVVSTIGVSALAGTAVLATVYGPTALLSSLTHAHPAFLAVAAAAGILVLIVRAQRAAVLMSREHPVRLADTYSAMVVGNGLGDLVPFVPGGVALRSFLTTRLSSVGVAYSTGVFMLEGTLDGLGLGLLSGLLVLTLQLPSWLRIAFLATLTQALLSFAVPVIVYLLGRRRRLSVSPGWMARLSTQGGDVGQGLMSMLVQGRGRLLAVAGLSLLITCLGGLQIVLFLSAFDLSTSPGTVLLILVLTLGAGNLPLNLPGSGTVSAAAALQVAGIHGAGVAGFVLLSRFVPSGEVTLMACSTLAWWGVTGRMRDLRIGATFQSLYQAVWRRTMHHGRWASRRLESIVSARRQKTLPADSRISMHRVCGESSR